MHLSGSVIMLKCFENLEILVLLNDIFYVLEAAHVKELGGFYPDYLRVPSHEVPVMCTFGQLDLNPNLDWDTHITLTNSCISKPGKLFSP